MSFEDSPFATDQNARVIELTEVSSDVTERKHSAEPVPAHSNNDNGKFPLIVPVILCTLISFGGFILGWDIGTIGGIVETASFRQNFGFNGERSSKNTLIIGMIVSFFNIGCAIGGLTLGKLGDRLGRVTGLSVALLVNTLGVTIQYNSFNLWYVFLLGRVVSGLATGGIAVLVPMFIAESAPFKIRGSMVCLYQLMITFGILMGNVTNYICRRMNISSSTALEWQTPILLGYAWTWLLGVGLLYIPESAPFLLKVKNSELEAKKSFAKMNRVSLDSSLLSKFIEEHNSPTTSLEEVYGDTNSSRFELAFEDPHWSRRLLLGISLMIFQQLSGINYFLYYGTLLFQLIGANDPYVSAILLSGINFLCTFLGIALVDVFGRKVLLILGSVSTFCCMIIYSSVGAFAGQQEYSSLILIIITSVYILCFATTLGPITFVVVSELFPLKSKNLSMSICTSFNWIFAFLVSFLTPLITSRIGFLQGYIFAGFLMIDSVIMFLYLPETKNKSEREIETLFITTASSELYE